MFDFVSVTVAVVLNPDEGLRVASRNVGAVSVC